MSEGAPRIWTLVEILKWTADYFSTQGIDSGRLDAELLLCDLLGLDRVGLYLNYDRPLSTDELSLYRQRVKRRARREPVQYILGHTEFWSLDFKVNPSVLIPRADTEVLVEQALEIAACPGRIVDLGTGSGAIAVALALECPSAQVVAVDISPAALEVARANAEALAPGRIGFVQGDLLDGCEGSFDLIVSNPPYVTEGEMEELMPEVGRFEPRGALVAGIDGLDIYRRLALEAPPRLNSGGWLIVEVGATQAAQVGALFSEAGLVDVRLRKDYAGIERVVAARKL